MDGDLVLVGPSEKGHIQLSIQLGHSPDLIVGDLTFVNVANEVLQFLSGDPNAKLTPAQTNDMIDAIVKRCGKKAKDLKITRQPVGGGGGGGAFGGGGFGGNPFGNWNIFDLLQLLLPKAPEGEHLA